MDKITWLLIGAVAVWFLLRFRYAMRKTKINKDKADEIQRKLQNLRKKRDEE
jgi:Na+/melibiose symporter-like transporter